MAAHPLNYDPVPSVNPTGAPNLEERISATPEMFGAATARAMGTLGQGAEHAADGGFSVLDQQAQMDARTHAAEIHSWQSDRVTDAQEKFLSLKGRAALDGLPQFKQDIQDIFDQARSKVGNRVTGQLVDTEGRRMMDVAYAGAARHAATERATWESTTARDAAQSYGGRALFNATQSQAPALNDDAIVQRDLFNSDQEMRNHLSMNGFDGEALDQEVAKNRGRNVENIVKQTLADGSPQGLKRAFEFYKAQEGRIDAASRVSIQNTLKGPLNQQAGEKIADEAMGRAPRGDRATPIADIPANFIAAIKGSEGYAPKAKWDYKQHTNGFGTKATSPDEAIDLPTANARFSGEIAKAAKFVDSVNPNLDPGTRAALTSLTFNAGEGWANSGLGAAVRAGDMATAKARFLEYNKAGGATNEDLVARRAREASWFGRGDIAPGETMAALPNKGEVMMRILNDPDLAARPQVQAAALAHINKIYQAADLQQNQDQSAFKLKVQSSTMEALDTGSVREPLQREQFLQAYGATEGDRQFADYQQNLQLGADIRAAANATPADIAAMRGRYQPQPGDDYVAGRKRLAAFDKAVETITEERKDDIAGFMVKRTDAGAAAAKQFHALMQTPGATPDMRKVWADAYATKMRDEEIRLGVPAEQVQILSKDQVAALTASLTNAATSDNPAARVGVIAAVQQEAKMWGEEWWPQVMRQLAPNVQPIVRAIAAEADPQALTRLLSIDMKHEPPSKVLQQQNEVRAHDLRTSLNSEFEPFRRTMIGRQLERDLTPYYNLAHELAAIYVRDDGKAPEVAAHDAFTALVGSRYDFVDTYRVPKRPGLDTGDVQRGAEAMRDRLADLGAQPPVDDMPGRLNGQADDMAKVARDGRWVTSYRNDGLNLVYDGKFVRGRDGQPLTVKWQDLAAAGRGAHGAPSLEGAEPVLQ